MALFPINCRLLRVERPAAMDRYGQAKYEVVATELACCLQLRRRFERTAEADFAQVDATLHLGPAADIRAADRVTVDDEDKHKYAVFSCDPVYDAAGAVMGYTASLTRIKEK